MAVSLLIALAFLSVIGGVLPQMPDDQAARAAWSEIVELRFARLMPLLQMLGLFNLFSTPLFVGLVLLLAVDTLLCAWPHLRVVVCLVRYRGAFARSGGVRSAASAVGHLAASILLVSLVLRPALSWRERDVLLVAGQSYEVGHGSDLVVRIGTPVVVHGPDGQWADCQVPLGVITGEELVLTDTVRVGHPVGFAGVTFHLRGYGPAVQVVMPRQERVFPFLGGRNVEVYVAEAGSTLRVSRRPGGGTFFVEARDADGRLLGSGVVGDDTRIEVRGVPVVFRGAVYVRLQAGHDPTFLPAVGAAVVLMASAAVAAFMCRRGEPKESVGRSEREEEGEVG